MSGRPRVILYSPSFGTYGGIQAVMLAIAESLSDTHWEPMLVFKLVAGAEIKSSFVKTLESSGCSYRVVRADHRRQLASQLRLGDVLHIHTPALDAVMVGKALRKPIAVTVHNHQDAFERKANLRRRWAMKLADERWTNSDFVAHSWRLGSGTYRKMPTVSRLPATRVPVAHRSGFVLVSRLIENKGIEELIEAYARAPFDKNAWPLTIVGEGTLRPKITSLIARLGVGSFIRLTGFVDDVERDRIVAAAKWLVAPAKTREDLGLTPIEARHVGVPVIVTRDGGLPEAGGHYALLCEPGDVEDLRDRLCEAATMAHDDYADRCAATRLELDSYLQPMELYEQSYDRLAGRAPKRD